MIYEITALYRDILPDHPKHAGKHSVHLTIKPGRFGRWLGKREQHVELLGSPAAGWLEIAKSIFQPMKPWKGDARKLARLVRTKLDAERAIDRQAARTAVLAVNYARPYDPYDPSFTVPVRNIQNGGQVIAEPEIYVNKPVEEPKFYWWIREEWQSARDMSDHELQFAVSICRSRVTDGPRTLAVMDAFLPVALAEQERRRKKAKTNES